ncbi:MAG TPA: hypothetical protein VGC92_05160, partial [Phenylobacterium sp.]
MAQPDRRQISNRYLIANVALWLVTYALITVRTLGMGTSFASMVGMGWRRALICASAAIVCLGIQRALLATGAWPGPRRILLAVGLSVLGGVFYTGLNDLIFYVIAPVWTEKPT